MMVTLYLKKLITCILELDNICGFINEVLFLCNLDQRSERKIKQRSSFIEIRKMPEKRTAQKIFCQNIQKETIKGTLIHECRTSDQPLCALRCVQEYNNPKVFFLNKGQSMNFNIRTVEDTLLFLIVMSCAKKWEH